MTKKVVQFFAAELLLALEHLHACGVIYRDLKLENVLLDQEGHVCLADFGLAKMLEKGTTRTSTICGTPGYLAPEILAGKPYGRGVDLWSLGVLIYELSTGVNPFLSNTTQETLKNIVYLQVRYPRELFSAPLIDLLQSLIERDPHQRITIEKMRAHPYFKGISWHKLLTRRVKPPFKIQLNSERDVRNFDSTYTQMSMMLDDVTPRTDITRVFSDDVVDRFKQRTVTLQQKPPQALPVASSSAVPNNDGSSSSSSSF
eukprot:CAMPEP_0201563220 /NCGR_PEP_ID=MMETSP0173_2-20130828/79762_1 /ASSEMBLY_ACC=CAM_ASM_000268 /TAXON_ID=218659 /ORGANISM="Vexillifera sp., Strain DIVA3 564/2" /LENGTH=257 /DNA_ID=CAMNT_0047977873 /DNA_START=204 /DNA_END=974 /DNA_ORIENTATION=+